MPCTVCTIRHDEHALSLLLCHEAGPLGGFLFVHFLFFSSYYNSTSQDCSQRWQVSEYQVPDVRINAV
ncbi:hypothetical protein BJY01DRAFT_141629 [Aspergillus pseudoustus]|uniref:Uncharacterized protein n=1 Tax=Aspergillus pseudoustus TaxID=1810923 RepID=A0ABR4KB67_9EURO